MVSQLASSPESLSAAATFARPLRRIPAALLSRRVNGSFAISRGAKIESDATLIICGPGFDEMTVRVLLSGAFYLVFKQDIEITPSQN